MSITKQTTTVQAAAAIMYNHFGKPPNVKQSRGAAWRSDFRNAYDAITKIESMLKGTGRKNQALMVIQSFSAEELDPIDPSTPTIIPDASYALAKEVAPNSPCDAVVHLDSDGGNPHAHVTIANVDLVTGDDGLPGKPAPAPYATAIELLDLEPAECVAVEDSATGAASARSNDLRVIQVGGTKHFPGDPGLIVVDGLTSITPHLLLWDDVGR